MSSNQSSKINIDSTTLVNLKAELLKKQEEFRLKRINQGQQSLSEAEYETIKSDTKWGKKRKTENKAEEIQASTSKEKDEDLDETEDKIFEKSRKMLETKAKYYEQVVSGNAKTEEGDEEIFLVDFDKKTTEISQEEEDESSNKGINLKNVLTEEEYNEQMRLKWQKEMIENLDKETVRYQDIKFDEIRNLGVGNFRFSRDEEERKKQMEFFKNIEIEIRIKRLENDIHKLKREKYLFERLFKVKQRRLLKHGYSLEQIKKVCQYDLDADEIDKEIKELEEKYQRQDFIIETKNEPVEQEQSLDELLKPRKKVYFDREWDKPKMKEKRWEKHIEKLRTERNKQFAPPKQYESAKTTPKKKKNKNKTKIDVEDNETKNESKINATNNSQDSFSGLGVPPPPGIPIFMFPPPGYPFFPPPFIPNFFPYPANNH